ncbi:MAG TPA: alpha/beta hydrolase [Candidatus Sulfotelmatobacter sp.]|nr:alpha/beta hydrolase [Candidatus Sulfotelmatobacter sp.]
MNGYDRFGEGPVHVLALHGWFGDERTFRPLEVATALDRFTYVTMAFRGYGASRDLTGTYTIEEIAADALALADALGWGRFHLLGHSMGGKAAQLLAALAPERVEKIVALAPVPAGATQFDAGSRALFEGATTQLDNRRRIIALSTGNRLTSAWVDRVARGSLRANDEAFAAYFRSWANIDLSARVAGSTTPVKVVIGRYDLSITERLMANTILKWFQNHEIVVMDNAGHYPMDETPIATATAIEAFLTA